MPIWNTPAGPLTNATKGEPYNFILSCSSDTPITFEIIAGALPNGLLLDSIDYDTSILTPFVWGVPSIENVVGSFSFTIRAIDSNNISDRTFSIVVLEPLPAYVFPPTYLGEFPDGEWMSSSIATIPFNQELSSNIQIISGGLPSNLTIDQCTGVISGFINPSTLYNSPAIYQNIESSAPFLPSSANSAIFSFTAEYNSGDQVEYSLTVIRSDIFYTGNIASFQYYYNDYVVPFGVIDGINQIFTLPNDPFPTPNTGIYYNGALLNEGADYTVFGNTITFIGFSPTVDSILFVFYTYK